MTASTANKMTINKVKKQMQRVPQQPDPNAAKVVTKTSNNNQNR